MREEAALLAAAGSCPPLLQRNTAPKHKKGAAGAAGATCSDVRAAKLRRSSAVPWVKAQLHSDRTAPCGCGDPVDLAVFGIANASATPAGKGAPRKKSATAAAAAETAAAEAAHEAFREHCAHSAGFESRACGSWTRTWLSI